MGVFLKDSEFAEPLIKRQQEHVVAELVGQSGTVKPASRLVTKPPMPIKINVQQTANTANRCNQVLCAFSDI